MTRRIVFDCLLLFSVFIFPWWAFVALGVIGLLSFNFFYEMMFIGIVADSLYNTATPRFHGLEFVLTLVSSSLFIGIELLKRRLKFY